MPVTAVVGAQWGDEGKGKVVDYLAEHSQMVIRFQGGDNAGHTIINRQTQQAAKGKIVLNIIPSGIFNADTTCIVGTGCVVNPEVVLKKMQVLKNIDVSTDNLWLSERAQIILPTHRLLDGLKEKTGSGLGTTKRGVGPSYADKMARRGIRLGDLKRPEWLKFRLSQLFDYAKYQLARFDEKPPDFDALYRQCLDWGEALGDKITNVLPMVQSAVGSKQEVLLEGQLGVMRDVDWGIYPYVTSSNPTPGYAAVGAGLPLNAISRVVAVVKAYSTAVGSGPFVTELHESSAGFEAGETLCNVGKEFGATTGRKRRCGWLDGVALAYSSWLNGFTDLAVTKLDVLDSLPEIKICTGYRLPDGKIINHYPDTPDLLPDMQHPDKRSMLEPVYETWPGWQSDTTRVRAWQKLPAPAQAYLRRIEELAQVGGVVNPRLRYVSVGPDREQMFEVS